jgi:iron-sulfur cluster repair protein YtfE (RIC family)
MTSTTRDDFFTLIHKGQRRELFAAVVKAGTLDWNDPSDAAAFERHWNEIHRMLAAHAKHEETHFFPLLLERTSAIIDAEHAVHSEQDRELTELAQLIGSAAGAPTPQAGLFVYRRLTEFVASYLLHQLDEETVVMTAIWQHCTDDEIEAARSRFVASQAPEGAVRSRRAVLPAVSRSERVAMLETMRVSRPAAFEAAMTDAERLLEPIDWDHLNHDLTVTG